LTLVLLFDIYFAEICPSAAHHFHSRPPAHTQTRKNWLSNGSEIDKHFVRTSRTHFFFSNIKIWRIFIYSPRIRLLWQFTTLFARNQRERKSKEIFSKHFSEIFPFLGSGLVDFNFNLIWKKKKKKKFSSYSDRRRTTRLSQLINRRVNCWTNIKKK
jgi:hypothetical protein